MFKEYMLPKDPGDTLYIMNAGTYTLSYASNFNGLEPPKVIFIRKK